MKGSRFTCGGLFGFKGTGPSGGRGLLSGVTSPVLLCLVCCCWGTGGVGGVGAGAGLAPGGLWCRSIMFCSISPVCLILLLSAVWSDVLTPGIGGGLGDGDCFEGNEAAIGSALGSLPRPGLGIGGGTVGESLCWAKSLADTSGTALPNPGLGDLGDPLSLLLVSEAVLLLKRALRALTSTLSS